VKQKLVLIPTPLDEALPLETVALDLLKGHCLQDGVLLLVEEHKVARQRWIKWGLPREAIERFILFNEHTQDSLRTEIIAKLKNGMTAFLMSDGGMPAFCDPGQKLVKQCHENSIKVTATPFPNSVILALALSGMDHSKFTFAGFLSTDHSERKKELDLLASRNETLIVMDTPYRLSALVSDIGSSRLKGRKFFIAENLNTQNEASFYGSFSEFQKFSAEQHKPEFVLVISGS
jgi:16S rRNA (cytidine1402-2'-O)-methyltransferase